MLEITNEHNLPLPLVTWLMADDYDYGPDPKTFSATSLIKSTKQSMMSSAAVRSDTVLVKMDVFTKLKARRGQTIHADIEKANSDPAFVRRIAERMGMLVPEYEAEQRLYGEIEVDGVTYKVSGKFDAIIDGVLHDWKTEHTISFGDKKKEEERITQLSIYKWLCNKNCKTVNTTEARYFAIYQDWMQGLADLRDEAIYPKHPMMPFTVPLWSDDKVEAFLRERIRERTQISIEELDSVSCTEEELWMKPAVYQYFSNPTAARASKNFDNQDNPSQNQSDALAYLASKGGKGIIKEKPRFAKRCEYCFGRAICSQYKQLQSAGLIQNEDNSVSLSPAFGEDC